MFDTTYGSFSSGVWVSCAQEVLFVSLGKKIKSLRQERNWSQDEFAYQAQIDGRQVSRYENDKVVPSIEVIIKIAKAFNISIDFLLLDNAQRRPLDTHHSKLAVKVLSLEHLSDDDEKSLLHLIDAIEAKNKLKAIAKSVE